MDKSTNTHSLPQPMDNVTNKVHRLAIQQAAKCWMVT